MENTAIIDTYPVLDSSARPYATLLDYSTREVVFTCQYNPQDIEGIIPVENAPNDTLYRNDGLPAWTRTGVEEIRLNGLILDGFLEGRAVDVVIAKLRRSAANGQRLSFTFGSRRFEPCVIVDGIRYQSTAYVDGRDARLVLSMTLAGINVTEETEDEASPNTRTFASGDSLENIAHNYFGDFRQWRDIAELNGIEDVFDIRPGTVIGMPERVRRTVESVTSASLSNVIERAKRTLSFI